MAANSLNKSTDASRKRGRPADTDSTDTHDRIVVCARERFAAEGFTALAPDLYHGEAEYETIAAVKASSQIPIVANGDINSPEKAQAVLKYTQADAVMIGRAAQGKPWIFREIDYFLRTGNHLLAPTINEMMQIMGEHLLEHYAFYGEYVGLRTARKHIAWYCKGLRDSHTFRHHMNTIESCEQQLKAVQTYFLGLQEFSTHIEYLDAA